VAEGGVTVLASLNVDITVRAPRIPVVGETIIGSSVETSRGGKGGNQAVALARLGVDTTVIACVGDDDNGRDYRVALADEDLATEYVRLVGERPTGMALITVDDAGENNIVVVPGANAALGSTDVERAKRAIQTSTVVLAQLEVPTASTTRAFALARAAGVITVLNPAPAASGLDELFACTDVLIPNEVEFVGITGVAPGTDDELRAACERLFRLGIRWVVVTLGAAGAALVGPDGVARVDAVRVDAIDTTAAGDSFVAGVVRVIAAEGNVDPATIRRACQYGVHVAALSVQRRGAHDSMPTADEVASISGR
jgi:ribokinase